MIEFNYFVTNRVIDIRCGIMLCTSTFEFLDQTCMPARNSDQETFLLSIAKILGLVLVNMMSADLTGQGRQQWNLGIISFSCRLPIIKRRCHRGPTISVIDSLPYPSSFWATAIINHAIPHELFNNFSLNANYSSFA